MRNLPVKMVIALALLTGTANAAPPSPSDNLGALTKYAIQELVSWDQGEHSSDPSDDGHGPGTVDEPRVGLANIVEQGNLQLTVDLIAFLLGLP
jgi:hypothetical protein